ncbi:MAG: hypothetical protein PHE20_01765 [Patescibacteria group bacterium]|nr:hypothetical protein [Patescibacteria group bacterium]
MCVKFTSIFFFPSIGGEFLSVAQIARKEHRNHYDYEIQKTVFHVLLFLC